jgi:hypothetical protein
LAKQTGRSQSAHRYLACASRPVSCASEIADSQVIRIRSELLSQGNRIATFRFLFCLRRPLEAATSMAVHDFPPGTDIRARMVFSRTAKTQKPFPRVRERACTNVRLPLACDETLPAITDTYRHRFPTRLSFGTAHRKRNYHQPLSHVMRTLISGTPAIPVTMERLWTPQGSGLCVAREPHLPRYLFYEIYMKKRGTLAEIFRQVLPPQSHGQFIALFSVRQPAENGSSIFF